MPNPPADIAVRARKRGASGVPVRTLEPRTVASGCPRCGGRMQADRLDIGDLGCVSCGHIEYGQQAATSRGAYGWAR